MGKLALSPGCGCCGSFCSTLPTSLSLTDPVYGPITLTYGFGYWSALRTITGRWRHRDFGACFEVDYDTQGTMSYRYRCSTNPDELEIAFTSCQDASLGGRDFISDGPFGVDPSASPIIMKGSCTGSTAPVVRSLVVDLAFVNESIQAIYGTSGTATFTVTP